MAEIRRPIFGYEGLYEVSNFGNVRNLAYGRCKLIKPRPNKGYVCVRLCKNGITKAISVHRLVGLHFIDKIDNKLFINHKNGIKNDNRVQNLEWCTESENQRHSYNILGNKGSRYGKFGKDNPCSKQVCQFSLSGDFIREWDSARIIQKELGLLHQGITACCRGEQKTSYNFIWKYKNNGGI